MAGAMMKFDGGYLGFERCTDPKTGEQYLRAVIQSASTGRTTSAPVEVTKVFEFATEAVKQALLADGHPEGEIANVTWETRPPPAQ